ncbi:FAD-binding oxidoreductase [Nocardia cyriacigeorgica]|uniref:NAD(P)/FAD-dependent oxidoreductase n=1 Tax=Nocardia cyriacigeorgica TaxID=135487 RepID=UPI00313B8BE3
METLTSPMQYYPDTGWVPRPTQLQPPVEGEHHCDVAVVGGGVGGMQTALRLAENGRDVTLLESDLCGWGASARNAGYLSSTVGSDPHILAKYYSDRFRDLVSFADTAVHFVEDLIDHHSIDCDYTQTGILGSAVTRAQLESVRAGGRILIDAGIDSEMVDGRDMGVPDAFLGGLYARPGGIMNPGKLALGLRDAVLASDVTTFEQSRVLEVEEEDDSVTLTTPHGRVRAKQVVLTNNAHAKELSIAPRRLATPVWVTAMETEPVDPSLLDAAGWTSRIPIVTKHLVMESFRTTARNTIVVTTRRLQIPRGRITDRQPDQAVVADLLRAFRQRLPTLHDVQPAKAWGGWISMTPSILPVAGYATPRVIYSNGCNGHGLAQAPYLGHLIADYLCGKGMHDHLHAIWRTKRRFAPGVVSRQTLTMAWLMDRLTDRLG